MQEKQMLLESHSINDRYILLTSILQNKTLSNEEKHQLNTNHNQNINKLLKILVCPKSGSKLEYDQEKQELISLKAKLAYPIINNIPVLIEKEARKINKR